VSSPLVAEALQAAARAQRRAEPTFGMLYLAKQAAELGEAATALEIANAATPAAGNAEWFGIAATVHAMLGRASDVEQLAVKALKAPTSAIHGRLAEAYTRLGDVAHADDHVARVEGAQRFLIIAATARVAIATGQLEFAVKLAQQPGFREADATTLAALEIDLGLALADKGELVTARRFAENAERAGSASDLVKHATVWAKLGDSQRAREIAADADTGEYTDIEALDVARAYAAAGDVAKVDEILWAYATSEDTSDSVSGYASAARAYLEFGRELKVKKRLKAAEAALAKIAANPALAHFAESDDHASTLAIAFSLDRQFAKAARYIATIRNPDTRVQRLLDLAVGMRDAKVADNPELLSAIQNL
jgi:hypothetical protein